MKNLYTMLFIAGMLLLPMNVHAAGKVALIAQVEGTSTIAVTNPCTTTTTTTATGAVQGTSGCGDAASPAGVSWNSGGG